jgi:capsular exopolysaccharide synthesis family protein
MGATQALPTLLITSATPLEGKSTTSCNLGISMAQAGQRVVIVDTDLRRSRLHKTWGVPNDGGFSNLLLGSNDVLSVVQPTEVPNLWVIPSGPLPPNPSELLGSKRMDEVIALLQARFDRVLFDSPPVIPVTDAIVIGRKVAGTIYVIKSGKVSRELAAEARRRLVDVNLNVVGVVLNDVDTASGVYSYQYTYYYGQDEDESRKAA